MGKIADILRAKGSNVHTVAADATVFEAIRKMVDANVGSLLVTEGDAIVGIITERDYLRRVALEGRTSKQTLVREIMGTRVLCVAPEAEVEACMAVMSEQRIRHLPVMDQGRLAGIVSIGDLVKQQSSERKAEIQILTDFIVGKYPA